MKGLFVIYIIIWGLVAIWAMAHSEDVDENGYFKVQWRWILFLAMAGGIPAIGKICGLG